MLHRIVHWILYHLALLHFNQVGAIAVKSIDAATSKWESRASTAATEFAEAAEASADSWSRNTIAAAQTWQQAIQSAGILERFRRGVSKAGAAKFARKIRDVGAGRYGSGVSAAVQDYRNGAEPYLQTIAGLTLSQRKPRGDPANYNLVQEVGKALHAKRLAMLGTGGG